MEKWTGDMDETEEKGSRVEGVWIGKKKGSVRWGWGKGKEG